MRWITPVFAPLIGDDHASASEHLSLSGRLKVKATVPEKTEAMDVRRMRIAFLAPPSQHVKIAYCSASRDNSMPIIIADELSMLAKMIDPSAQTRPLAKRTVLVC